MLNRKRPMRLSDLAMCCICGKPIDKREIWEGGSPDGCEWVCTIECYEVRVPL